MKTFNVIAINGGSIARLVRNLVGNLVDLQKRTDGEKAPLRRYMNPDALTIEVDEEGKTVNYNGQIYEFVGYSSGINGSAKTVQFNVQGFCIEVYTDTPSGPWTTSEKIRVALKRRRKDPNNCY